MWSAQLGSEHGGGSRYSDERLKETNAVFLTAYFMVINSYELIPSLLLPDEDLKSLGLNF